MVIDFRHRSREKDFPRGNLHADLWYAERLERSIHLGFEVPFLMDTLIRKREVHEACPSDLEEAVSNVNSYPTSVRYANELYEVGLQLIRQNSVRFPVFPYRAELIYVQEDSSSLAILTYERFIVHGMDKMQAAIITPEEKIGVEVLRYRGARVDRNAGSDTKSYFEKSPAVIRTFCIDQNDRLREFSTYDLVGISEPAPKRR